jgi:hypothetical protein
MNAWYWSAVVCGLLTVGSVLLPAYVNEDGQGVYYSQMTRSWNWVDADGHPIHDDFGNRIHPNRVRTVAIIVFANLTVGLAAVGFVKARRRRKRLSAEPPAP